MEKAKEYGTLISFDLNYRASFWKGREEELRKSFQEIANISDILIGNEEDFQLALGIEGPEAGGKDISAKIDGFKGMIERVQAAYPNVAVFATTLREVFNANAHNWGGIMLADGEWYVEMPREIQVMDRIGGGDGFVGGLLYGILKDWKAEDCLHFGWATGVMAATMLNDYAQPADEEQVWAVWSVQRAYSPWWIWCNGRTGALILLCFILPRICWMPLAQCWFPISLPMMASATD